MKYIKKIISIVMVVAFILATPVVGDYSKLGSVEAATAITGDAVVTTAKKYIGTMPYVSGGLDLSYGVDCSGFVCAIYRSLGADFVSKGVRSTYDMRDGYTKIYGVRLASTSPADVRNGDLVITNGGGHVGIGTDSGTMIHQTNSTKNRVEETSIKSYGAITAIIRIDYTKWGGVNASNASLTGVSTQVNETQNLGTAASNPAYPLAVPTTTISGADRDSVKWLQTALNKVNNAGLVVDGALGNLTKTAISNFQAKYGLSSTGTADVTTINKIVEIYKLASSITSISISEQNVTLNEGSSLQLTTVVSPASAKSVGVTWSTSNSDNLTVSSSGLVKAVEGCESGKVTITAKTINGKTATTVINVVGKPRKNEWFKGKWYGADGRHTYQYTGSWKLGSGGWWYGDTSGWYAYNQWQKIDDKWYYFNARGYIVTGWQKINGTWYYFKSSGEMAENEWCNGYWLSKGGAWSYQNTGSWRRNSKGWWYQDTNGWYPKNETVKINGVKYTFTSDGYWDGK